MSRLKLLIVYNFIIYIYTVIPQRQSWHYVFMWLVYYAEPLLTLGSWTSVSRRRVRPYSLTRQQVQWAL